MTTNFRIISHAGIDYLEITTQIPLAQIQGSQVETPLIFRREIPDRFLLPNGTTTTKQIEAMLMGIEMFLHSKGLEETNRLLNSNYIFGRSRPLLITEEERERLTPDVHKRYDKTVTDLDGTVYYVYAQFSWREQKDKPGEKDGASIKLIRRFNENGVRIIPLYESVEA